MEEILLKSISQTKFALVISMFLTLTSFLGKPDYTKLSDQIVKKYCKKVALEKGLFAIGSGGRMMYDIEEVGIHFVSYETMSVEEGRKLYVEIVEDLLKLYNENEKIRPFLHNYPFTIENLNIMVMFEDSNHHLQTTGLSGISYVKQKVGYKIYRDHKIQWIHEEPYSTALEIVQNETLKDNNLSTASKTIKSKKNF